MKNQEALKYIWDVVFSNFAFNDLASDRFEVAKDNPQAFVGVAALLTCIGRELIEGPVPGIVIDGADQGVGKSLMSHVLTQVINDQPAMHTYPAKKKGWSDDIKLEKSLNTILLDDTRLAVFDNVSCPLDAPVLEHMLTAYPTINVRRPGQSKVSTHSWRTQLVFNGNNVQMSEDIKARVLVTRLVRHEKAPFDVFALVHKNAKNIREACGTILTSWLESSNRPECGPWASFEAWTKVVPSAIVLAGGPNVLKARG